MRYRYLVPFTALAAALSAGCDSMEQERFCTDKGGESGVRVGWDHADFADGGKSVFRLCAKGSCEERAYPPDNGHLTELSVRFPDSIGAATVPVRLTITAEDGRTLLDDTAEARLKVEYPNGKGCDPTNWNAFFKARPGTGLTEVARRELQEPLEKLEK
jgi:hypothetical protein